MISLIYQLPNSCAWRNFRKYITVNPNHKISLSESSLFMPLHCWSEPTRFRYFWSVRWPFLEFKFFVHLQRSQMEVKRISAKSCSVKEMGHDWNYLENRNWRSRVREEWNARWVRKELVLRIQNGGFTTQHDTENHRESFLIWSIFDLNLNLQMGKSFNFI